MKEAGIAQSVDYGLEGPTSIEASIHFFLFTASRPPLGPTQSPIEWVPGTVSSGIKLQEREADLSLPSSAEVKNSGAIPPLYIGLYVVVFN
jgi:hypothetical protein